MDVQQMRDRLVDELGRVKGEVEVLKISCCTNDRHCIFDDLKRFINDIEEEMKSGEPHPIVGEMQKKAMRTGNILGRLAVSCCDGPRIGRYMECITRLNKVLFYSFSFSPETSGHSYFPDVKGDEV